MNVSTKKWMVPLALLILSVLSFGLLIPALGFYWDDWPSLVIHHLQGAEGFRQFFSLDRPTTYLSYVLLMPVFDSNPVGWQIFTLGLRWLTAVLLWWFVRKMWPEAEDFAILASLLFAIYPVFRQQSIALTYHQLWMEFAFYLLSLAGMLEAIRHPNRYWLWTCVAVIGLVCNYLISEYFLGIELIRPVILWLALFQTTQIQTLRERVISVLRHWAPYLLVFIAYLAWRFIFMDLPGPDRNAPVLLSNLLTSPLSTILILTQMAVQDISYILITNWYTTFQPELFDFNNRFNLITLGITVIACVLVSAYLLSLHRAKEQAPSFAFHHIKSALLLGALITILGPLPAWATSRQVIVGAWSDRLAVPAMLGASILLAGLIAWFIHKRSQQILIACLLIGLAVGNNLRVANDYRWARIQQNRFYWQLAWRVPDLAPATAIFAEAEVLPKTGLYSTAAGINLIYTQPSSSGTLPYWFFSLSREFSQQIPELVSGMPLSISFRQFTFSGTSPNSLIVYYHPDQADCLRILTPQDRNDPALSPLVAQALPISNLATIRADSASPKLPERDIFGPEPDHGWCYYFQKADLARQLNDWQEVTSLGEEAESRGYSLANTQSNTPQEWIPFIEGYAHTGNWQKASQITQAALSKEPKIRARLCDVWRSLEIATAELSQQSGVSSMLDEMECNLP